MKIHLKKSTALIIFLAAAAALAFVGHRFESNDDEPFITKITPAPSHSNTFTQKNTEAPANDEITQKVNINTADKELLMTLKGIGESFAERIIAYRNEHGAFKIPEDIMLVDGIGRKKFDGIKDSICTE